MPAYTTDPYSFFYPTAAGDVYPQGEWEKVVKAVRNFMAAQADLLGGGFFSATDFNASIVPGSFSVNVSRGAAFIGPTNAQTLIYSDNVVNLGESNADGIPVGSGPGTVNYFFLKKNGLWHIDQDNSNPGDGAKLAFTATFSATEATAVSNNPTGRVNLSSLAALTARLDVSLEASGIPKNPDVLVTAAYGATAANRIIRADATAGAFTITLPTLASMVFEDLKIIKVDAGANVVTLDGNGAETINGALTYPLSAANQSVILCKTAAGWYIF